MTKTLIPGTPVTIPLGLEGRILATVVNGPHKPDDVNPKPYYRVRAGRRTFLAWVSGTKPIKWTRTDSRAAMREGWDLFEAGNVFQIQRDDEAGKFRDDFAALAHVKRKAKRSELHHKALLLNETLIDGLTLAKFREHLREMDKRAYADAAAAMFDCEARQVGPDHFVYCFDAQLDVHVYFRPNGTVEEFVDLGQSRAKPTHVNKNVEAWIARNVAEVTQ